MKIPSKKLINRKNDIFRQKANVPLKTTHSIKYHDSFSAWPISNESIQLVITSPPYPMVEMWDEMFNQFNGGIGQSIKKGQGHKAFEKMHRLLDRAWMEVYRVLIPGGFVIINIGDATRSLDGHFQMYSNHSRIIQSLNKIGFDTLPYILWRKPTNAPNKYMGSGMLPGGAYVTLAHEHILIFRKGGKRNFEGKEKEKRKNSAIFWEERNEWYSDQWDIRGAPQRIHNTRERSASFPLEIALRPTRMYSIYGDTVLDPFGGFGTTNLAAMICGRNSISFDLDQSVIDECKDSFATDHWIKTINEHTEQRLLDHIKFCYSKEELFFKYRHDQYNIPIKTRQEKALSLYQVSELKNIKEKIILKYRPWPSSQDIYEKLYV